MKKIKLMIESIENKFKFDFKYLLKNGLPLLSSEVITGIFTLILSICFARYFSKEVYGEYKYIMSFIEILTIFSLAAMTSGLATSIAKGFDGSYKKVMRFQIYTSFIASFIAICVAYYYFYFGNNNLGLAFSFAALLLPFYCPLKNYTAIFQGKKLFTELTVSQIITQFIVLISLLLCIYLQLNSASLVFAFLGASVIGSVYYTYNTYKLIMTEKEDEELISFGMKQSFVNILGIVTSQLDKILIFHFLGAAQLAIYAFAIALPEQIKGVFKIIPFLALPKFVNTSQVNLRKTLWRKTILFLIPISFIIGAYILAAPYIYKLLFPQYMESIFYSQIFSISLLTLVGTIPMAMFQSKLDSKNLSKIYNSTYIIQITSMIIGIYMLGFIGLIVSRLVPRFYFVIYTYYLCLKRN